MKRHVLRRRRSPKISPKTPPAEANRTDASAPAREESPSSDFSETSMSFGAHLTELRVRLMRSLGAVFAGFVAMFYFAPIIRAALERPLRAALPAGGEVTFADIAEPFIVDMQIALVAGIFIAAPYIFYQMWAFIAPGLYESERRHVVPLAMCSALFFIGGGAFCYFVVLPFTFHFFITYGAGTAKPLITLANLLRFSIRLLLAFGLMFEMPLVSFFLARLGVVTADRLRSIRKYAILVIFIVAALITPPEVFSQLFLAGPLILLYELSILVAAVTAKKTRAAKEQL